VSIAKPEPGRRPVEYTPELAKTICDRLANYETLREICADPAMPDRESVVRWLAQHVEFRDDYADMRYWQGLVHRF
jgi:Bacteriophage Sf6, terminase small subunit-like